MTRGDYIRQLNDHDLAEAIAGTILFSLSGILAALEINTDETITDDMKKELVDGIQQELEDEYV